jgi:RNase H-fold protein (predicted Holliday junction resolvase)
LISTGQTRQRRRQLSDQVAAALILQGHLDSQARRGRV